MRVSASDAMHSAGLAAGLTRAYSCVVCRGERNSNLPVGSDGVYSRYLRV